MSSAVSSTTDRRGCVVTVGAIEGPDDGIGLGIIDGTDDVGSGVGFWVEGSGEGGIEGDVVVGVPNGDMVG
jgi:hypothetical protein